MTERIFNNAKRICREIMIRIARGCYDGTLNSTIERMPLEMRPSDKPVTRCCIYKDRAVIKYRCMASLGFAVENETDELMPLVAYYNMALGNNSKPERHLTVLDVACDSCPQSQYIVANTCRGCAARPCTMVCPKNAVSMQNGQAIIDQDLCIKCGKCETACPFHAVIRIPVPCEESCPVKAIYQNEQGRRIIDQDKCIHCGKCVISCPFGAVMECSQVVKVIQAISSSKHVTAMPAPALEGQFPAGWSQLEGALKQIGFDDVVQVGFGAEKTISHEAEELAEKLDGGQLLMTTSCCPSYMEYVDKHATCLKQYVSNTPSPMNYAAQIAREKNPETVTVFIGPCLAKRVEAVKSGIVDHVLTFEELGAMLVAAEVFIDELDNNELEAMPSNPARGFAMSSGVAAAVQGEYKGSSKLRVHCVDGIDKKSAALLKKAPVAINANFIEVMACEGGCLAGPGILHSPDKAKRQLKKNLGTK